MKYPKDPEITSAIYSILYDLGVSAETTSFFHTAYALRLATEDQQKLLLVTKWLYPEVARHYRSNWHAVERNIRAIVHLVWTRNPKRLELLAGKPLFDRPTPSQFLFILSSSLIQDHAA